MIFDIVIRASAITLLILILLMSQRDHVPSRSRLYLQLACVAVIGALLDYMPPYASPTSWVIRMAGFFSMWDLPFIWLFTVSLFDRRFSLRWYHCIAALIYSIPKLMTHLSRTFSLPVDPFVAALIANFMALIIMVHLLIRIMSGRTDDLLDARRRARLAFAMGIVLFTIASILAIYIDLGVHRATTRATLMGAILVWSVLHLVQMAPDTLMFSAESMGETDTVDRVSAKERALMTRVEMAMATERAFLEPGLTLGSLARRLGAPEHRLRAAICQGFGYDNFSVFVNAYRINAIKAAFTASETSHLPILTIALDHGFASLSPFNRAFKAQIGMTPSAYRKSVQTR